MKFVKYKANSVFVVSESTSPISSKLHLFSEHGSIVGSIDIGDDPEDFIVEIKWYGYEPVLEWLSDNWRKLYKVDRNVVSIINVPKLELKYDEE